MCSLRSATLLKRKLWHRCFPVNFAKFVRTPFLTEHLGWLLLFKLFLKWKKKLWPFSTARVHLTKGYEAAIRSHFLILNTWPTSTTNSVSQWVNLNVLGIDVGVLPSLSHNIWPNSCHWPLFLPPENIRESLVHIFRKRSVEWKGLSEYNVNSFLLIFH